MESQDSYKEAKKCALNKLDRKEHSVQDIARHLIEKGFTDDVILAVMSELKEKQLINDDRFARMLSRDQASRGKGPYRIRQKLREKGIQLTLDQTKALTEEVTQTTELESAKEIVRRRFPNVSNGKTEKERKEYNRALQTLLRRGFSMNVARMAIEHEARRSPAFSTPERQ